MTASEHNVRIVQAKELPGFEEAVWLSFPPKDLMIDFIIGHGVVLGKQAQIIRDSHNCEWMQVVHTVPDELAVYKNYCDAIPKGEKKQWDELKLCQMADVVVAVGPKMSSTRPFLGPVGKKTIQPNPSDLHRPLFFGADPSAKQREVLYFCLWTW